MSDDLFELGERIADLAARINIATFDMLTLVADFDRREGWADNFASCAEWLAWRTGRWADGGETGLANTILLCRRHHRLVHEEGTRMALDRDGKAAFFTRAGQVLGTAPPLPEVTRQLPEPPPPPPGPLSNGAPRFVDSAVPLSLELEALEAVA